MQEWWAKKSRFLSVLELGGGVDRSDNQILLKVSGESSGRTLNREKTHFHLEYKGAGAGQMLVVTKKDSSSPTYGQLECTDSLITFEGSTGTEEGVWMNDSEVYGMFFEQDQKSCKRGINRIECDIELKGSNLKWNTSEKPKVIYTAF